MEGETFELQGDTPATDIERLISKHAIAHERIFLLLPEVDANPAGEPLVELRLD